jgi:transposase
MARPTKGKEVLEKAKDYLGKARTAEELRQARAVVLPLKFGLSLRQTAEAIGRSVRWTSQIRSEFIRRGGPRPAGKPSRGGRRLLNMTPEKETLFLTPFLEEAKAGGILVITRIKQELEKCLGRKVALASAYNLLHRHGWRKLAPDKRNPKGDVEAQAEWKKIAGNHRWDRPAVAGERADQADVSGRSAVWTNIRHQAMLVPEAHPPALPVHSEPRIHVCLCSGGCYQRENGQLDSASCQWSLHANLLGRGGGPSPGGADRGDSGWDRMAPGERSEPSFQSPFP